MVAAGLEGNLHLLSVHHFTYNNPSSLIVHQSKISICHEYEQVILSKVWLYL